jgi:hypothetical protein
MSAAQPCTSESTNGTPGDVRIERTIKHGDTTYDLAVSTCAGCGRHPVFRVMRTFGASLSVYEISYEDAQNLEEYVAELHTTFAADVATRLIKLRETILEYNAKGFFEANGVHPSRVRLVDKARLISSRFSKKGLLEQILKHADDESHDLASAFLLGCLATDNHWLSVHEEAVFEGYAHIEGRESGRPLALAARIRQGKLRRRAILEAASKLYQSDPALRRNDSKTADRIVAMKLETLRKRDGTFLGADAIIKHLRVARSAGNQLGNSK